MPVAGVQAGGLERARLRFELLAPGRLWIDEVAVSGEILSEPDADLMCWQLARALPDWTGGRIPVELEPYRERPDLQERYVTKMRSALAARLAGERHLSVPVGIPADVVVCDPRDRP